MNCKHPDHNNKETCEDRAIGCDKDCICCMGELKETDFLTEDEYEDQLISVQQSIYGNL